MDYKESNKALDRLENIDLNDPKVDDEILYLLRHKIFVPFIQTIIPSGLAIFRARKNENNEEFTLKDEISYNADLNKISLGRANKKGQSIFYASHKMETALFETTSISKYGIDKGREVFTIGRWCVKEPFLLVALLPRLDMLDKYEGSFQKYKDIIEKSPLFQEPNAKRHLKFFSDQFARPSNGNENLYKISSLYFNHCLEVFNGEIYGILYPSVEYEYKDLNLALLPEAVDKYLILDMVAKYEVNVSGENGNIMPLGIGEIKNFNCKSLGFVRQ